ncbi:MAG: 4Fe-4S dicluster domain-containing protein [Candidatus Portnoybacteria bacterium]|nr:4Fe-4S dicluster domain-containing protein [Candidatus Portnoybacteria bacterium]
MNNAQLRKFFDKIKEDRVVFGPAIQDGKTIIKKIDDFRDLKLDGRLPIFSFKRFFLPEKESLFEYVGVNLSKPSERKTQKIALFGVNARDLKSILIYDQVFEKDPWYQERRENILVIGQMSATSEGKWEKIEEDLFEHLSFDIFLARFAPALDGLSPGESTRDSEPKRARISGDNDLTVFSGSVLGREVLENSGYNDFIHIQFSGPVKEKGIDKRMLRIKEKLEKQHDQAIWDRLGARCIECGKCSIVCPTCFCFRIDDQAELGRGRAERDDRSDNQGTRNRCWDSCFYQEFSELSGGHKFLNTTAKKIHFWYFHKFVRIPEEFDMVGCVGCGRCAEVCPVGIDIKEVLKEIEES